MVLTDKDQELIGLLKQDARASVSSLARRLGVSRSTVQDRLNRLEEQGVITGYQVVLAAPQRPGLRAMVMMEVAQRNAAGIVSVLERVPELSSLYTVAGKYDLVGVVEASDPEKLDSVLDKVSSIQGISRTESVVILSTKLDRG